MYQFFISVRTWCRRSDKTIFHTSKERKELLIRLCAVATKHGRFIQCRYLEIVRVNPDTYLTVTHTLIIRHHDIALARLHLLHRSDVGDFEVHVFLCLSDKLHNHTLRTNYQGLATFTVNDYTAYLQLRDRLLHSERTEYSTATSFYSPFNSVLNMREQRRHYLTIAHLETTTGTNGHFLLQKINIFHNL